VRVLRDAVRGGWVARDADGGAPERDRPDQPDDPRVVLHLDRRAPGPERPAPGDRVAPADVVRARDAGPYRRRRGDAVAGGAVAVPVDRLDGGAGADRGTALHGCGVATPRPREDPRGLALSRVRSPTSEPPQPPAPRPGGSSPARRASPDRSR